MKHGCSSEILQAAANATKRSAQKKCMLTQLLFEPKAQSLLITGVKFGHNRNR